MKRINVAIGPVTSRASWKWLGPHLAGSLAETCTVHFFRSHELPLSDVVIFIKERPLIPLQQACDNACEILYMPVDFYRSRAHVEADTAFLARCSGLLVHSRRLAAVLAQHISTPNTTITQVDHPNFYGLARKPPYRPDGRLLWIGDFLNLPFLLRWLEGVELPFELDILTNPRRTSVGGMAMTLALARRLGVELDVRADRVNGLPMHEWDVASQRRLMANAKAALDIKGGEEDFFQFTKPPTKGQQFIVSGIPFAANSSSSITADLLEDGFCVADPADQHRWFSQEYWQLTRDYSTVLEQRIRPEAVALRYQRCLTEVLDRRSRRAPKFDITPGVVPLVAPEVSPALAVAPAPLPLQNEGLPARWLGYARACRVLLRLRAAWPDVAPHRMKIARETWLACMPGYVKCTTAVTVVMPGAVAVSVLIDAAGREDINLPMVWPDGIPGSWEVIALRPSPAPKTDQPGWGLKTIRRWPRRSVLRDRMLAAKYAEGSYLAFVTACDADLPEWIAAAVAALEACPHSAMVRREGDSGGDIDQACTFVVRRKVWLALQGYGKGLLQQPACCGDLDLEQRVRQLGFAVEPAPADAAQHIPGAPRQRPTAAGVVVYTAITNAYDRLLDLDQERIKPARQIAFLDAATRRVTAATGNWEVRTVDGHEQDPNRAAKRHKICPELFFPEAEYSLWIDGNVSLVYPFDIQQLIDVFLADTDLCIGRHYARSCIYQEAEACKQRKLDSAALIDQQVARYRQEGFPAWYGLNQAVVILRRHSPAVKSFNQLWWQEISQGSRRDQLSFNYVQWKTGLPVGEFPFPIQDQNGLFSKVPHQQQRPLRFSAGGMLRTLMHRMEAFHFDASESARK